MHSGAPETSRVRTLAALAVAFGRLGVTAFGGPAAHIAMMEAEFVRRRRWLSHERFLDLFGVASLIPGPSSTELAIFLGYERAGVAGLVVAGVCFILPAALIVGLIAWAYVQYGSTPHVSGMLYGIKPVVIAIIAQAIWMLGPKAIKSRKLAALSVIAVVASAAAANPLLVLVGAGVVATLGRQRQVNASVFVLPAGAVAVTSTLTVGSLFLFFLKVGAVVFGSGYVLLAYLHDDLVTRLHWLTEAQLLDAVAVGQVTPGPVFTTATFIGYVLKGVPGAAVATVGIFLPGFVLVAASRPLLRYLRSSPTAGAFLDGVNAASLALMAVVAFQLARSAFVDVPTILIGALAAVALLRFRVNSTWLVLGGALGGAALKAI